MKPRRVYINKTNVCVYYEETCKTITFNCGTSSKAYDIAQEIRQLRPNPIELEELKKKYIQ